MTKEVAPIMAGAVVSVAAENGEVIEILAGKGLLVSIVRSSAITRRGNRPPTQVMQETRILIRLTVDDCVCLHLVTFVHGITRQ